MKGKGFGLVMAMGLDVNFADDNWVLSIRRVDGKRHDAFMEYDGEEVGPADVGQFLPNWEQLKWTEIDDPLLGKSVSCAEDGDLKATIQAIKGDDKTHVELCSTFRAFMQRG